MTQFEQTCLKLQVLLVNIFKRVSFSSVLCLNSGVERLIRHVSHFRILSSSKGGDSVNDKSTDFLWNLAGLLVVIIFEIIRTLIALS